MSDSTTTSRGAAWGVWLTTPALFVVAVIIAFGGGSQTRPLWDSIPILITGWAFAVNIVAWVPAWLNRSERFYDAVGSITFISSILIIGIMTPDLGARVLVMLSCVGLWSLRMGYFLITRIRKAGQDGRFDDFKKHPIRFLNVWAMQALWAVLCLAPVLALADGSPAAGLDIWALVGLALWVGGFLVEVVADQQKRTFRDNPANQGRFIQTGLWAISRHPNYLGEIMLWAGLSVIAFPLLMGWQLITLISPVFVYILLTRVSGIPLLEERADARWGGQSDYETYKRDTPMLIPFTKGG